MTDSQDRNPVEVLADEFIARVRRGERPSTAEYAEEHPELADEIRELFPLLVEMEDVRSFDDSSSAASVATLTTPELTRLGDYRIIREIARGGMGIVYEAEQVSLGRRVALKVLPKELLESTKRRRRFEREAKAAARLHHTNIVPVFGVGEDEGQIYYVMQFIQGLPLDEVLVELKRLQAGADDSGRALPDAELNMKGRSLPAHDVTRSLLTGTFGQHKNVSDGASEAKKPDRPSDDSASSAAAGPGIHESPAPQPPESAAPSRAAEISTSSGSSSDTSLSGSSIVLPVEEPGPSYRPHKKQTYWDSIARIGIQVAEALEYAHGQGVMHRDVKPSNLLLDMRGTVWVADFGLAKLDEDRGLTQTGEVLGTVRYMAPETFKGQADARSELYGLGLTLYELLVFRPAFDKSKRKPLIDQVMHSEVEPLAKLNPEIPVDLQTIVHKAIERDPADRYQTAQDLADDLRRFVDDEPIKARRVSLAERVVRWSRHNRGLAASLATVALLIILLAVGSTLAAGYFRHLNRRLENTVAERTSARDDAIRAHFGEARAHAKAATEAREAVRARCKSVTMLADMHTERGFLASRDGDAATAALWFASAAQLTPHDPDRQAANRLRARNWLSEAAVPLSSLELPTGGLRRLAFQPDGRLLLTVQPAGLRIWDWQIEQPITWSENVSDVVDASWSPEGKRVAVAFASGEVQLREPLSGEISSRFEYPGEIGLIQWSPDGRRIAVGGSRVQIWNVVVQPELEDDWPHPDAVYDLTFNQEGDRLATACRDKLARLFAVGPAVDLPAPLFAPVEHAPHSSCPDGPVFCDGDRKLFTIAGNRARWWDVETGRQVTPWFGMRADRFVTSPAASRDGPWIAADGYVMSLAASPDGRWIAGGGHGSCAVWNSSGFCFRVKHGNNVNWVAFAPDSRTLMTSCYDGKTRFWSLPSSDRSPVSLPQLATFTKCAWSADGKYAVISDARRAVVWRVQPANQIVVGQAREWDHDSWRPRPGFDGRLATLGAWFEGPHGPSPAGMTLNVAEMSDGRAAGPTINLHGKLVDSCLCADNRTVASVCAAGDAGILSLHDVPTGIPSQPLLILPELPIGVAARPGRSQVAVLCRGGQIRVFDTTDASQMLKLSHEHWGTWNQWTRIEYSPDGSALITVTPSCTVCVRDADTGRPRFPAIQPVVEKGPCRAIAVSMDGRWLATGVNGKNTVQVWDLTTGVPVGPALPHPGDLYGIFAVEFSPDGRQVLTGHKDGRMRLWDWKSGKLTVPPMQHPDEVYDVKFLRDGRFAVAAVRHSTVHLWDLSTGKMAASPVRYPVPGQPYTETLGVAGSRVMAGADRYYPVLDLSSVLDEPEASVESLMSLAVLSSGQELKLGELSLLEPLEWEERWAAYEKMRLSPQARAELLAGKLDQTSDVASRLMIAESAAKTNVLTELVRLRPEVAELHRVLAREFAAREDHDTAVKHRGLAMKLYKQQLSQRPDDEAVSNELARLVLQAYQPNWEPLVPVEMKAESGATLTRQPDGSILAGPASAEDEAYVVQAYPGVRRIAAVRLGALSHRSLPQRGPGWCNGNFQLSNVEAQLLRTEGGTVSLRFRATAADYLRTPDNIDVKELDGCWGTIDNDPETNWDIWPHVGTPHWLVWQLDQPIAVNEDDLIYIELEFRDRKWSNDRLGCFRLSVSADEQAVDTAQMQAAIERRAIPGSLSLAAAYLGVGETDKALDLLERHPEPTRKMEAAVRLLLMSKAQQQLAQQQAAEQLCGELVQRLHSTTLPRILYPVAIDVLTEIGGMTPRQVIALLGRAAVERELARLSREIDAEPESAGKHEARGRYLARLGRWRESANDYRRAVQLAPDHIYGWLPAAACLILAKDEQGYRHLCESMVEHFQVVNSSTVADITCKVCLLRPGAAAHSDLPVRQIREATIHETSDSYHKWSVACRALIALREENSREAMEWANKAIDSDDMCMTLALIVRATAEDQMGLSEQARETLALAESAIPVELRTLGTDAYNGPVPVSADVVHHDWLIAEILRREAEALLGAGQ